MIIAGFDEVGRGAWAGPLVVAGVALASGVDAGFRDSKHYTAVAREAKLREIYLAATAVSICVVPAHVIDEGGLGPALKNAFIYASQSLQVVADEYIVDGSVDYLNTAHSRAEPKADDNYQAVAASSIVAKVHRDWYMQRISSLEYDYGFAKHFGYGTALHSERLQRLGPSTFHRYSFKPIQALS